MSWLDRLAARTATMLESLHQPEEQPDGSQMCWSKAHKDRPVPWPCPETQTVLRTRRRPK